MITAIFLLLAAAVVAVLEYYWANYGLRALHYQGESDRILAEPDEVIALRSTVENHSFLPIPFARLHISMPWEAKFCERQHWIDHHCSTNFQTVTVEEKMSLKPRAAMTSEVHVSFPKRGYYHLGNYTLSCGDLLGFNETYQNGVGKSVVIMPERSKQQVSIDALGGFLGDISVRRFILEDPILTMGFREYTGREPMKAISWTRSAAAGSLQVKQFDHTAEHHIVILLNTEGASKSEFEECLRLTRMVCEKLEQKKMPYGFRTNGNLPGPVGKIFYMAEGLGYNHMRTILYGLGRADDTCFYSFRYLAESTLQHRNSNESYIIITPPLKGDATATVRKLENVVGNSLCILTARPEKTEKKEVAQ